MWVAKKKDQTVVIGAHMKNGAMVAQSPKGREKACSKIDFVRENEASPTTKLLFGIPTKSRLVNRFAILGSIEKKVEGVCLKLILMR